MELKDIVKNNEVRFAKYRQGFAYYTVRVPAEGVDYIFPVRSQTLAMPRSWQPIKRSCSCVTFVKRWKTAPSLGRVDGGHCVQDR